MASQNMDEKFECMPAPTIGGEPENWVPPDTSTDPEQGDEDMDKNGDENASQNQGNQDNVEPEDQNENVADVPDNIDFSGLSFPRKLWVIVENNVFESVNWSDQGDTVVIQEDLFQREILRRRGAKKIFETDSLKSFIRQLNLYGFRKIRPDNSSVPSQGKKMMIYRHSNFQRDKPQLLEKIQKKGYLQKTTLQAPGEPAMKKKKLVATRHSPRIHQNNAKKKAKQQSLTGAPSVQGTSGTQSHLRSGMSPMRSATGCPQGNRSTFEPNGSSGEGTSSSATFTPIATARMESTREGPASLQEYPEYASIVSLYNTCYSILLAALSVMSPNEPPENEEPEDSSDYKCALCEQFKNNPNPNP
ncbi:heat shock transcription factor, X-linked member 4 [Nycticebus coucang]|uniref:heat shock transcription factor, X-linked member 4 n=1 Tax=Nycticebus coucang TaxID=9470 RepID=UPI00234DAF3F|nr:heat shock transcription factor, X-linked member 4 [Nycticebus coucang]